MYPLTLKGPLAVPTVCKFNNSYSLRHRYVGFVNLNPGKQRRTKISGRFFACWGGGSGGGGGGEGGRRGDCQHSLLEEGDGSKESFYLFDLWIVFFFLLTHRAASLIVQKSPDLLNVVKDDGFAALHLASLNGHHSVVECLIKVQHDLIDIQRTIVFELQIKVFSRGLLFEWILSGVRLGLTTLHYPTLTPSCLILSYDWLDERAR